MGYRIGDEHHAVAVSGDTAQCDAMAKLASGADVLIHEALDAGRVRSGLLTWNASAASVGALANNAHVRHLILTHLIPPPATTQDAQRFKDQARAGGYEGTIEVASDLQRIPLES